MASAIEAVQNKSMGTKRAALQFKVPRTTLRRRLKTGQGSTKGYLGGYKPTFDANAEAEISEHIKNLELRFFGLSSEELRRLVFQIAETHNINHRFNRETGMAGKKWLKGFLSRNPRLSLRTPEKTSAARAQAFNKENVKSFFHGLEQVLDKYKFPPQHIYNVDETGMSTVPTKSQKILATKGRKQVGILSSAERGLHYTAVCCMNAIGTFVPPAFIFPRKRYKAELMEDAPISSVAFCQETGWMNGEIFLKWLKHFTEHVKPSPENKVLLILDGHGSHKTLEVLEYTKQHGIILFCLPAHCTHKLQPLDVGFYNPLQTYYNGELKKWLRNNPGRVITHFQVAKLFNKAYLQSATTSNAVNSFRKCGIYPFNPDVFEEWEFAPSLTTDKEREPEAEDVSEKNLVTEEDSDSDTEDVINTKEHGTDDVSHSNENAREMNIHDAEHASNISRDAKEAGCSYHFNEEEGCSNIEVKKKQPPDRQNITLISIEEISPLPKAPQKQIQRKRKRAKTGVLNSTPDIEEMKSIKQQVVHAQCQKSAKKAKRAVTFAEEKEQQISNDKLSSKRGNLRRKKSDSENVTEHSDQESNEAFSDTSSDVACIFCNELFSLSRPKEPWIQCQTCSNWCHVECAGVQKNTKMYICEVCV